MDRIGSNWSRATHVTSFPSKKIESLNRMSTSYQISSLEDHIM
jgi:hypothetical protein